jgi:serine/threonine protein kinase
MSIKNFIIKDVINCGNYGIVKKAIDTRISKNVAIKIMPLYRHDIPIKKNNELITREIDNWTTLSTQSNKNILQLNECFQDKENIYFVTELCSQGSLFNLNKKFNINEIKIIIQSIVKGMFFCHEKEIAHCDIKPANILLSDDNNWKLCDFGNSQKNNHEYHGLHIKRGTPFFTAPELFSESFTEYGNNIDIWAIGILTYYLLYNKHPLFDSKDDLNIIKNKMQCCHILKWDVNNEIYDFINKCIECDNKKRMNSFDALNHPFIL